MSTTRPPLMESSDNLAMSSSAAADAATRRRSGRAVRAPDKFNPDAQLGSKRKRSADDDDEDQDDENAENESPVYVEQTSDADDDNDNETVEEEATPRQGKKQPSQANKSKKPAAKKPKVNGTAPASSRHTTALVSRPKKTARVAIEHHAGDTLYADVFGSGDSSDDVAGRWYTRYQQETVPAVTNLVNCILLAAGCDQLVTDDDINDPDNCPNRLTELQGLFEDQQITDYPLISRAKSNKNFRELLVGFFRSLINVLHETSALYNDAPLMENIVRWVSSMSSSGIRPFRHTATTVALGMLSSLAEVAKKLDDRTTKLTQQVDGEKARQGKKKDKSSKDKLVAMEHNLNEANENRQQCGEYMKEFFDTVFVHRYRDVDFKVRTECVEALGTWVWVLPTDFMQPGYLRYLGWMLSDTIPTTRQEVLKQLSRLFKRDADKLGHFIDRFRPRLVEMATKDADVGVRVAALSVIENLRATGMLEPDEIDAIGKLMFDSEPRIRKAVVTFFADCVSDLIETKLEEIGGEDAIADLFSEEQESFDSPRRDWINIKCLAENLAAYEQQLGDANQPVNHGLDLSGEMVNAIAPESRISLAAQGLFEKIPEVREWEILAGYLLFDHTVSTKSKSKTKARTSETQFRAAAAPEGQEEAILLEVLAAAVKLSLGHDKQKPKVPRLDADAPQEDAAIHLATVIPGLLKKFGSDPSTATIVLRLEHSLDLDVFQQLRQNATTYSSLLDEICTQFNRHVDKNVIAESASALLHARRYEELVEVADSKIALLWENVINSLRNFSKVCELSFRLNLEASECGELSNILLKIGKLASVSDCIDVLEANGTSIDSSEPAIDILISIVSRGKLENPNAELDDVEDELVAHAINCCHFYFLWKSRQIGTSVELQNSLPSASVQDLANRRKEYQRQLINTLSSRGFIDDLRLFATGKLCDLAVPFGVLKRQLEDPTVADRHANLRLLIQEIPAGLVPELIEILENAERSLARKLKRTLNQPDPDEDPLDDDLLDDLDPDEDLTPEQKRAAELKSERVLCELAGHYVLAIVARMLDCSGPSPGKLKRRLRRNQNKLGQNFKNVIEHLDEKRSKEITGGKKKPAAKKAPAVGPAGKKPALSADIIVGDDSDAEIERAGDGIFDSSPEPEEGTVEDLRRRELLEDEIDDEELEVGAPDERDPIEEEDDDVLGD